jgi:F-type H+-transporting ATPase subunit c
MDPNLTDAFKVAIAQSYAISYLAAGIGAGLTVIGGAYGIGRLAAATMEGIARQPNAAGDIKTSLFVAAGMIEGATLFGLVVTILLAIKDPVAILAAAAAK